jgi:hypothetical protein
MMSKERQYQAQEYVKHIRPWLRKRANKIARRLSRKLCEGGKLYKRGR